jgi:hypothetical protein
MEGLAVFSGPLPSSQLVWADEVKGQLSASAIAITLQKTKPKRMKPRIVMIEGDLPAE